MIAEEDERRSMSHPQHREVHEEIKCPCLPEIEEWQDNDKLKELLRTSTNPFHRVQACIRHMEIVHYMPDIPRFLTFIDENPKLVAHSNWSFSWRNHASGQVDNAFHNAIDHAVEMMPDELKAAQAHPAFIDGAHMGLSIGAEFSRYSYLMGMAIGMLDSSNGERCIWSYAAPEACEG